MRLICPSCGAQYEVDAELIPAGGRDVQCSACGHVWLEEPGASVAAEAEVETPIAVPVAEEEPPTLAEVPPPVAPARVPRRTVTPAIAEILREEAAREQAARAAEAQAGLERQEELPLPEVEAPAIAPPPEPVVTEPEEVPMAVAEPVRVVAPVAVPAATIRPDEPRPAPAPAPPAPARRDRLPDIEQINSTLRPAGETAMPVAAEAAPESGRGFRLGFSLVVLVAALLALAYVYAPRIVVAVPQAEPVLTPYVSAVDGLRLWLDLRVQGLMAAMGGGEG